MVVGFFDRERASGQLGTAEELNEHLSAYCEENDLPGPEKLTESHLSHVRQKRGELFAQWETVQPGGALELLFDPASIAPSAVH